MDKEKQLTREEIRRLMEQERNERLQECLRLVNEAQMKTGCKLTAEPIIMPDGHISAKIVIVDAGGENENL